MFFRPSPEARQNIKLPMDTLLRQGCLSIRTDLQDNHLYILDRSALALLQAKPALANIKQVCRITAPFSHSCINWNPRGAVALCLCSEYVHQGLPGDSVIGVTCASALMLSDIAEGKLMHRMHCGANLLCLCVLPRGTIPQ